jgi:predicted ThiF/HesA family dinucleotide-utilizing enzyme
MQARIAASTETTGTLTSASANKTIQLTGNITINNSVFAAGDVVVVYAGASSRTITAGTITTMRLDGTSTTGSRTVAAYGMASIFFVSATECVVSGGSVT